ncbi:MAG TPA: YfhO family protein [Thermoanaerobaculia bacterium]|nr:YfhO family protein [Thermoanaerobaculia bacterium]
MRAPQRHDLLAVALLLLLPTLFFGDVLLGLTNFAARDLTRYYYPTKQIYGRIVEGGEFPLWNRYFHAGQPLAANPEHEIFYPLTWLLMLPDFDLGYRLHILVHIYVALLAMYALLRSMRIRAPAACFGALSWGMGGLVLSWINLLPILFCAAWLPATCLFVRRFLIDRRPRDFALAALFFGLQCLVAEPTTLLQTGFLLGMYAIYRGLRSEARGLAVAANIGWIALIAGAAFAVGAVQLLPAIDHAGDSARAHSFPFQLVEAWSTPWGKLIEFVFPNFLGHVQRDGDIRYWGGRLYAPMGAPFLFSIYPGLAVVALAAAGFVRRTRGTSFVAAVTVISLLLALGSHTPLLRLLYDAGVATKIRYPEKFLLMAIFVLTVFAASVCERLLDEDKAIRSAAAGFALATALTAAAMSLLGLWPASLTMWTGFFGLDRADPATVQLAGIAWTGWSVAAGRGLVLFVIVATAVRSRRTIWAGAALLFVIADLGFVVRELNPRMPGGFFTSTPPVVDGFHPDRNAYRIFHLADWQSGDTIGFEYPQRDARYWIVKNGLFPMMPAAYDLQTVLERDYDETALAPSTEFTRAMWDVRNAGRQDWLTPFLAMANAWYVGVVENQTPAGASDYESSRPVRFVEREHHPRYYFADQLVPISGRAEFVHHLVAGRHGPRVAFIEGRPFRPADGKVLAVRETANRASIDVEAAGKSFLVMSVTPHRHWRVSIDGRPVPPVVTNIGFQGIVVERGTHRVAMRYRNRVIELGAAISAAAVALLALTALLRRNVALT